MNVLMLTNTYYPNVCGVTRSIASYSAALRRRGQRVLIVAPESDEGPLDEPHVVRVPALPNFSDNDIAVRLPIPGYLTSTLNEFQPDVIHVHQPFLLGNTGLRIAATRGLPVVLTYHTMYEHYTHYIAADSPSLERFTVRLATEFANQCDHVIAPSESVAEVLRERGVEQPITTLPTGIDTKFFASGNRDAGRQRHGIPKGVFVVGHVGRLAPEKNLGFLAAAVVEFLRQSPEAHFLVVGDGPSRDEVRALCEQAGLADRLHLSEGKLQGQALADAYRAMDVMAFASKSETQGMVLAEAMAAGAPVVALDAPGARDILRDGVNGRLLPEEDAGAFAAALAALANPNARRKMGKALAQTADQFSMEQCVGRLLNVYRRARESSPRVQQPPTAWNRAQGWMKEECNMWMRLGRACYDAVSGHTLGSQKEHAA